MMGRPRASPEQQLRAHELYRFGLGPKAIWEQLDREFEKPVSLRTVSEWAKGFKAVPEATARLDEPFEWHRMEEYGLPWEAGECILEAMDLHIQRQVAYRDMAYTGELVYRAKPITVRLARWVWRVHKAAPRAPMEEVYSLAARFADREARYHLFGEPFKVDDLEADLRRMAQASPQHKPTSKLIFKGVQLAGGHGVEHEAGEMREEAEANS